jgi:hypothetical protein
MFLAPSRNRLQASSQSLAHCPNVDRKLSPQAAPANVRETQKSRKQPMIAARCSRAVHVQSFGQNIVPFSKMRMLQQLLPFMSRAGISIREEICPDSHLLPQPGLHLQDVKKPAATLGLPPGRWLEDVALKTRTIALQQTESGVGSPAWSRLTRSRWRSRGLGPRCRSRRRDSYRQPDRKDTDSEDPSE